MSDSMTSPISNSASAEHSPANLRAEVDALIAEGAFDLASRRLAELWRRDPASGTASFVTSRLDELRGKTGGKLPLTKFKLAILRSFTVEPIVPLLRAEAFAYGIDLEVHVGDFNTYVQDILDSSSSLYRFAPNAVVLAVGTDQAAPELCRNFADLSPEGGKAAVERVVRSYEQAIDTLRKYSPAVLIIHSLESPSSPSLGILDSQSETGQSGLIHQINRGLRRIAAGFRGVYILDYEG